MLEYYFPIYYNTFKTEVADTFMFLHNVKGVFRMRYARDLYYEKDLKTTDIKSVLKPQKRYINKKVNYNVSLIDSLYEKYITEVNTIIYSKILYRFRTVNNDYYSIYNYTGKLFIHKMWRDSSSAIPQQIKYNKQTKQYKYVRKFNDDYFIMDEKNLIIYKNAKEVDKVRKIILK